MHCHLANSLSSFSSTLGSTLVDFSRQPHAFLSHIFIFIYFRSPFLILRISPEGRFTRKLFIIIVFCCFCFCLCVNNFMCDNFLILFFVIIFLFIFVLLAKKKQLKIEFLICFVYILNERVSSGSSSGSLSETIHIERTSGNINFGRDNGASTPAGGCCCCSSMCTLSAGAVYNDVLLGRYI